MSETPGFLHRKISKILNKLQLYSAVRSTIHNVRKQQNGDENETKLQRIVNINNNNSYLPPNNNTNNTLVTSNDKNKDGDREIEENQQNDEFDERFDEPFVFDDEIEDVNSMKHKNDNKLSLETGNIGIHIMEIFGSIATIFLSAAYQVGMYANSFTGSNQALVTSKPIEGVGTTIKWKINK